MHPLTLFNDSDLSMEAVILLILGIFMLILGALLSVIQTGVLPYSPDSTYGLFLVLISFQIITMGKTPFGDLQRSWFVIIIGICAAVFGMLACFIPGAVTIPVRIIVGIILFAGGVTMLFQLLVSEGKAKAWIRSPGILRRLTIVCCLVYLFSVILGIVTLIPGLATISQTSVFLLLNGISMLYLSWCIRGVRRLYPQEQAAPKGAAL